MSMKCFAQNTKQITHSSHASYPSISLPVSKVLNWGIFFIRYYVISDANLDQLRCTPVFRDLGTEEKREGFIF